MMSDFTYREDREAQAIRLYPENDQARVNWNKLHEFYGFGGCPIHHWPSVKAQLKRAGYTVRKARPVKIDTDSLLAELLS